jgi:hypothetical protein
MKHLKSITSKLFGSKSNPNQDTIIPLTIKTLGDSTPVENFPKVLQKIVELGRGIRLTKNNTEEFKKLFGKHIYTFTGEFHHKIWQVQFQNTIFELYSGKRGTSICMLNSTIPNEKIQNHENKEAAKIAIAFVETINKQLERLELSEDQNDEI